MKDAELLHIASGNGHSAYKKEQAKKKFQLLTVTKKEYGNIEHKNVENRLSSATLR